MNIWFISDTHGKSHELDVPNGVDMVVHAGDGGTYKNPKLCKEDLDRELKWLDSLPIKYVIYIPGNHDTAFEAGLINVKDYPNITFIVHEYKVVGGLKIFGSPYTPWFYNWAYNETDESIDILWEDIPNDLDILVTHGPPHGILDKCQDGYRAGCKSLLKKVMYVKPKIHVFGHIHEDGGRTEEQNGITFINASILNLSYNKSNNGYLTKV